MVDAPESRAAGLLREREMLEKQLREMRTLQQQIDLLEHQKEAASGMMSSPCQKRRENLRNVRDDDEHQKYHMQQLEMISKEIKELHRNLANPDKTQSQIEANVRKLAVLRAKLDSVGQEGVASKKQENMNYPAATMPVDAFIKMLEDAEEIENPPPFDRNKGNAMKELAQEIENMRRDVQAFREDDQADPRMEEELIRRLKEVLIRAAEIRGHDHENGIELGKLDDEEETDEERKLRRALEQARELGRIKSLHLKRQEQEVATLQKSIEGLENRLMQVRAEDGTQEQRTQEQLDESSSVNVEAVSQRSGIREEGDRNMEAHSAIAGDGNTFDEDKDEGNEEIGELSAATQQQVRFSNALDGESTIAHAGSTLGEENAEGDASVAQEASAPHSSSNTTTMDLPSDEYLDSSDYKILLEDVYTFIDDCRAQPGNAEQHMTDRDFGRRMVHFISKFLNELSHMEAGNLDKQRQILRMLRRSND